jgi:2-succinyl-5-enolpyruvyl-6-hydroxy-3-cyclohexene-1-carboxylate synthase
VGGTGAKKKINGATVESLNAQIAQKLLEYLHCRGVKRVVLCPGSRNAPLLFSIQASNKFQIYHHLDERSAAFFALGLMYTEKNPVGVFTTSGTAAAELLPACIESYYQQLPLILVTADRPQDFRGSGAPQSIEQVGLFSIYAPTTDISYVEDFQKIGEVQGPIHLNVCLDEPGPGDWLLPQSFCVKSIPEFVDKNKKKNDKKDLLSLSSFLKQAEKLLVVVGSLPPDEAKYVSVFLNHLKAPVLADASSNIQTDFLLKCGEKALKKVAPTHVLRIGSVPSFRFWRDLEKQDIPVLSFTHLPFKGLARLSFLELISSYNCFEPEDSQGFFSFVQDSHQKNYFEEIKRFDDSYKQELESLLLKFPDSELGMLRRLSRFIPEKTLLYLGNSLPIREWNLVNQTHSNCFANRGANGIDGQVSTFLGLCEDHQENWAVLGDQTALYDLNALAFQSSKSQKRRVVVLNNGGGKIFSHLSYSSNLSAAQSRLIENQHKFELRAWADLFAWSYERWDLHSKAERFFADDLLLEVFPDSLQTTLFWREWKAL